MQIYTTQDGKQKDHSYTSGRPQASQRFYSIFLLAILSTSNANPITKQIFDTDSHLFKSPSRISRRGSFSIKQFQHRQFRNSLTVERSLVLPRGGSSILQDSDKDKKNLNVTVDLRPTEETVPRGRFGRRRSTDEKEEDLSDGKVNTQMVQEKELHRMNPRLANMIRLLFITYYGSLGALMPFLPVYFHSLGHGGQAIGLLGAVKPLTTFIVAPIWGIISDYSKSPNFILQLTFCTSFFLQLLLPLRDDVRYLIGMVFLTAVFNAPVKSLIDSMVMDKLDESDRSQYGKLRLYGQLGFGLGSSAVGTWISKLSEYSKSSVPAPTKDILAKNVMNVVVEAGASAAASEEITKTALELISNWLSSTVKDISKIRGYKLAFLAYAFLSIPTFFCMRAFQQFEAVENKDSAVEKSDEKEETLPRPSVLQGIKLLLHNNDAILFFFLVFVVGTTSGIIENFAYVRVREVGGTGKEMGICRLVSSLSGAPMFWFSGSLTKRFGADRVLVLSLLSYVVRFLFYAFMKHPYHALPAESLRGITFAAFWSTGTVFAHKISPPGMSATMLMLMNAMYGGLGQSIGAIVGGKLQSRVGTVNTFLYSAMTDLFFVICVTMYLSLRKDSNFRNPRPILPPK